MHNSVNLESVELKTIKTKSTRDFSGELSRQSVGLSKFHNGRDYSISTFKRHKNSIKHGFTADLGTKFSQNVYCYGYRCNNRL